FLDCAFKILSELLAVARRLIHSSFIIAYGSARIVLGSVHGEVGVGEQPFDRIAVVGGTGNSNAPTHYCFECFGPDGAGKRFFNTRYELLQVSNFGEPFGGGKFVAADAADKFALLK